ncbi:MAG TPA: hypothetical protein VFX78_11265 [Candidatus Eisenbacteria bacterium]|nr:hypothetical protein [Candidatus Eisenbacteria bacterium]
MIPGAWRLALAAVAAIVLAAGSGEACPSCGARAREGGAGYVAATLVLLVVPLVLAGGLAIWLRRDWSSPMGIGYAERSATRDATRSASSIKDATDTPR